MEIKQLAGQTSTQLQNEKTNNTKSGEIDASKSKNIVEEKAQESDTVTFSSQSTTVNSALKSLESISEVRQNKIDALTQSISTGKYTVNSQNIANKLSQLELDLFQKA